MFWAWRQMNALKTAQRADWRALDIRKLQVKLYYFVTSNFSGIGYRDGTIKRVSRIEWRIRQSEIAIAEACIAETISEWPQRLAFEVAVGAARPRVVLEMRQLTAVFIECDGK